MKKILSALCASALILNLAGCSGSSEKESSDSAPESSTGNFSSVSSGDADSKSSAPEENKGEPTFLTCVDGTVVYTSDITSVKSFAYDIDGSAEQFSIEDLTEENFISDAYNVVCGGFVYAFTSSAEHSFNPVQNPDKFRALGDDIYEYTGEEIAPSGEYYRVEPGDKFGELTVKSAQTKFYANYADYRGKGINGAYMYSGTITFDGELELTGYIRVSNENEGYDQGGEMRFVPDNEYVGMIPLMKYEVDLEKCAVQHSPMCNYNSNAYNDISMFSLGSIHDYNNIDLDGVEVGERFTHVKITIGDIVSRGLCGSADIDAKLLSIKKIP